MSPVGHMPLYRAMRTNGAMGNEHLNESRADGFEMGDLGGNIM